MKTTLFTLLFAMTISIASAQVIRHKDETQAAIWVWSIQGQATYQEDGFKMARPLHEGTLLTHNADIWVSENGQVVLLYNGTSTALGQGAHSISDLVKTPSGDLGSGFANGTPPTPPATGSLGDRSGGSGFGQGAAPAPAGSPARRRDDDGSGFGQGVAPEPTGGNVRGRRDEGSGFGQGVPPEPTSGGTVGGHGDEGSGFGQSDGSTPPMPVPPDDKTINHHLAGDGVVPQPDADFINYIYRHRENGAGFGQGAAPAPTGGLNSGSRDNGSGFGQGAAPEPAGSPARRRDDDGSGFGQGVAPEPTGGNVRGRGDEGSGFGQGVPPEPTSGGTVGGHGDEGSGFGQGATPEPPAGEPAGGRGNNDGSGFGDGATPEPAPSGSLGRRRDDGSGFGDGVTPTPPSSGGLSGRRDKGSGHNAITTVAFQGGYNGFVTPGPVDFIWTPPGPGQTCQFKIWNEKNPGNPVFQANTARSGMILDLRDLNLMPEQNYVATISLGKGKATELGTINFSVVGPEVQLNALQRAQANLLYPVASPSHQAILKAMELERAELNTAATVQYQRASELNPFSDLVKAMILSFKKKHGLLGEE